MYLVRQPRGMHLRAHTRTRSLHDWHAFHDGEAREVMLLSRVVLKVSQLACFKLYRRRKGCSEGVIVGLIATPWGRCCERGIWSHTLRWHMTRMYVTRRIGQGCSRASTLPLLNVFGSLELCVMWMLSVGYPLLEEQAILAIVTISPQMVVGVNTLIASCFWGWACPRPAFFAQSSLILNYCHNKLAKPNNYCFIPK